MNVESDLKMLTMQLGEDGIESLIRSLFAGLGVFDYYEGNIKTIYLDDSIKVTLGYSADIPVKSDLAGIDYYVHPDDMDIIRKDMQSPRDIGKIYNIDLRILSADSGYHWFNVRAVLKKAENGHEIWNGVYTDIADKKEAELRLSRRCQSANGAYGILEYSRESGFKTLYVTEDIAEISGFKASEEEISYIGIFSRIHPYDRSNMRAEFKKAIRNSGKIQSVFRLKRAKGGFIWVKPNLSLSYGNHGKTLIFGTLTDIDNLVKARMEAESEHKRIRSAIKQSNITIFDWNHKTGEYYISDGFKAYAIAEAAENYILRNQADTSFVHPDDLHMLDELYDKSLKGESHGASTVRMKMTDGSFRWTTINCYFTQDYSGALLRRIATLIDVDKERRSEEEMQMTVRRLKGVIDDTNIQYWEYDIINDVAYIGDILRKVYSLPEVMENFPESLIEAGIVPDDYLAGFRKLHIILKNGALFSEHKLPMNSPGGTVRWKHIHYRTIFSSESAPSRAIGTAIDITDQVTAENKLKEFKRAQKAKQN